MRKSAMDIFAEIKVVEEEALKLEEKAGKEKEALLAAARKEAQQFIRESDVALEKMRQEAVKKVAARAERAAEKIRQDGRKRLETLKDAAGKKREAAVKLVLDRFGEMVHDSA
jgi:vacuolar-type H+-ATPase subunit H